MLQIINTKGLVLQLDNSSVEFELNSLLLSDKVEFPGSHSYPISFSLSPHNTAFLGYDHLPEMPMGTHDVQVQVNGILLKTCVLSYNAENTQASGYLRIDSGELADKMRNVYLWEVMDEKVYLFEPKVDVGSTLAAKQAVIREKMLAMAEAPPGQYPIVFYPIYNPNFAMKELNTNRFSWSYSSTINRFKRGAFEIDTDTLGRHVVPFIYLTHIFKRIAQFFGYKATGNFLTNAEIRTLTVYNTQALENASGYLSQGYYADLRYHVPYMKVVDFLKAFKVDFGLGIFFDSSIKEMRLEIFRDIRYATTPAIDLSKYLLAGFEFDDPAGKGYTIVAAKDEGDELQKVVKPYTQKLKSGDDELTCQIGTLAMTTQEMDFDGGLNGRALLPHALQKGNLMSNAYRDQDEYYSTGYEHTNRFELRLLSYRGMREGSRPGLKYPFATSMSRDYRQNIVTEWSLTPEDPNSIFQVLTVPFYNFLANSRRITYRFLLPLSVLKNMQLHRVYSVRNKNSVATRFVIEKLTYSAPGSNGLMEAKAQVYVLLPDDPALGVKVATINKEYYYVELELINELEHSNAHERSITHDMRIRVWLDEEKTLPANVTNLEVKYAISHVIVTDYGMSEGTSEVSVLLNGHEYILPNLLTTYEKFKEGNGYEEQRMESYRLRTSSHYYAFTNG